MNCQAILLACVLCAFFFLPCPVAAMDTGQYGEIQQLVQTPLGELTEKAAVLLGNHYHVEELALFGGSLKNPLLFNGKPGFVFTSKSTHVAYLIATLKPQLLARYPSYATCGQQEYRNLLHCFFTDGKVGTFNDAAANCPTCYHEAILIYLWTKLGVVPNEVIGFLRLMFDPAVLEPPPMSP
ncbi:MAG TPA: hypothetical protein VIU40_12785 [Geobacteraceae bacterium]